MTEKEKIPIEKIKKIPKKLLQRLINRLREYLENDEIVQNMLKEYGVDFSFCGNPLP